MCHVAGGAPCIRARGKSQQVTLQNTQQQQHNCTRELGVDEDGDHGRALLLQLLLALRPAAPATAQPYAAATTRRKRARTAVDELAGGRVGGGARAGGHGRRVLPALRLQAHHALRR